MVRGHLDLLLLGVLRAGPRHGYSVISELRALSEGQFDLPEGTVYPALHRLESAGLVSSHWSTIDGRKRRVYALTGEGHAALAVQRQQWFSFARGVDVVLAT